MPDRRPNPATLSLVLWIIVAVELVSPIPAVLTFGAAYVLAVRPPWFLRLVRDLYAESEPPSSET